MISTAEPTAPTRRRIVPSRSGSRRTSSPAAGPALRAAPVVPVAPLKTTARITSAKRTARLTILEGVPGRLQVKGNWAHDVAIEVTTRSSSANGMRLVTVLTRNVAFGLPVDTVEVVLSTIRPAHGVSLDVTIEPFGAPQVPELPTMRHERPLRVGSPRGTSRPSRGYLLRQAEAALADGAAA
jgi:hypothetical protein